MIPKSQPELAKKPGPLTVTVDPQYISNVHSFNVYMKQAKENDEFVRKPCENPKVSSMNPIVFTLDWSKCPRAVERPEQLWHLHIEINVVYKGGRGQQQPKYTSIRLNKYSTGFYRKVFGGGKARLVKILTIDSNNKSKEAPKIVFLEDPTGTREFWRIFYAIFIQLFGIPTFADLGLKLQYLRKKLD